MVGTNFGFVSSDGREMAIGSSYAAFRTLLVHPLRRETTTPGVLGEGRRGLRVGTRGLVFRVCVSGVGGRGRGRCESGKMAAAAVVEFQRAQSLLSTDREASIDILHSIGKGPGAVPAVPPSRCGLCQSEVAERGRVSRLWCC